MIIAETVKGKGISFIANTCYICAGSEYHTIGSDPEDLPVLIDRELSECEIIVCHRCKLTKYCGVSQRHQGNLLHLRDAR